MSDPASPQAILPLGRRRPATRPLVVFRGDLRSITGYGHETRMLAALFPATWQVLGVDLHPNPADDQGVFRGRIVSDDEVAEVCRKRSGRVYVINNTPPDFFVSMPGAVNIGAFYWETQTAPSGRDWPELIQAMDYNWAKSTFHRRMLQAWGVHGEIPIVTWPLPFDVPGSVQETGAGELSFAYVATAGAPASTVRLDALRREAAPVLLSVSSLAPRKGLPVLLSEWRDHVAGGGEGLLVLKLRPIHNSRFSSSEADMAYRMVAEAGFRNGDPARIAFNWTDLSARDLGTLYRWSDAYVTASYGEGFGGPVAEALIFGRPVISPRHTSLADIIPPDYPFEVRCDGARVGLMGNSPLYPAVANWNVPLRGALAAAIATFVASSEPRRREVAAAARVHAAAFCSAPVVRQTLRTFFERLEGPDAWV